VLLACVALSGCLTINKALGNKIDLKDQRVESLTVASTGDGALCPGHVITLIATATLDRGERVQTETAGGGKVLWSSFTHDAPGAHLTSSGILSLEDDIANPWAPIHLTLHVGQKGPAAVLDVPLRFDCSYFASYGGDAGDDGDPGVDHADGSRGGDGGRGSDGADGQRVQVFVSIVREPTTGASLLKVFAQGSHSHHFYYVDPERGSFLLRANGGDGGDGGYGGYGFQTEGPLNKNMGAQGDGGNGGNGGSFLIRVSPEAAPYMNRIHFENAGGPGGQGSTPGRAGHPGPPPPR
jgi:hypothetical protein